MVELIAGLVVALALVAVVALVLLPFIFIFVLCVRGTLGAFDFFRSRRGGDVSRPKNLREQSSQNAKVFLVVGLLLLVLDRLLAPLINKPASDTLSIFATRYESVNGAVYNLLHAVPTPLAVIGIFVLAVAGRSLLSWSSDREFREHEVHVYRCPRCRLELRLHLIAAEPLTPFPCPECHSILWRTLSEEIKLLTPEDLVQILRMKRPDP
jgi:hypothetical protein